MRTPQGLLSVAALLAITVLEGKLIQQEPGATLKVGMRVPEAWGPSDYLHAHLTPAGERAFPKRLFAGRSRHSENDVTVVGFSLVPPGNYVLGIDGWAWRRTVEVREGENTLALDVPEPATVEIRLIDDKSSMPVHEAELLLRVLEPEIGWKDSVAPDAMQVTGPPVFGGDRRDTGLWVFRGPAGKLRVDAVSNHHRRATVEVDAVAGRTDTTTLRLEPLSATAEPDTDSVVACAVGTAARNIPVGSGGSLRDFLTFRGVSRREEGDHVRVAAVFDFRWREGYMFGDLLGFLEKIEAAEPRVRVSFVDFGERDDGEEIWRPKGLVAEGMATRSGRLVASSRPSLTCLRSFLAALESVQLERPSTLVDRLSVTGNVVLWDMRTPTPESADRIVAAVTRRPDVQTVEPGRQSEDRRGRVHSGCRAVFK